MIQPGRPQLSAKPREVCPVVLADARAGAYGRSTTAFHRRTRNSNANRHRPARYQSTIYRNVGLRHKHCKQEAKRLQYDPTTGRRPLSPVNKFRWGLFLGAKQSLPQATKQVSCYSNRNMSAARPSGAYGNNLGNSGCEMGHAEIPRGTAYLADGAETKYLPAPFPGATI